MNIELTNIIKDLNKIITNNDLDVSLEKNIYKLLRICLKEKVYEVEIGNYILNINPNNLYVSYDTPNTILEITDVDTYIETERDIESRFFHIGLDDSLEYDLNLPIIKVEGKVFRINNTCKAEYIFNIVNGNNLNIKDYINGLEIIDDESALLELDVNGDMKLVNPLDYLKGVIPVYLEYKNKKYIKKEFNYNDTYNILIPKLDTQRDVCLKIYKYIVNFYNEYANNGFMGKSE